MGNGGRKLERFRTYNQAILKSGLEESRTIAQRSPWPAYGRIQQVDGSVNSNYHALSAKMQQAFLPRAELHGRVYVFEGDRWRKRIAYEQRRSLVADQQL